MTIFSQNPSKFVEDALFCTGPLALSYSDPDQKRIIRDHLVCLLQDFSQLKPSIDFFTNNDGTEAKLLNIHGELRISQHVPNVPIIIWLPELYPQMAPTVYVDSTDLIYPIYENHPFVDCSSGATASPYITNWKFTKCNLTGLVRNLIKLFSLNHPFYYSGTSSFSHPSMVSKSEAMDRLVCTVHYDINANRSQTEGEIEHVSALQAELQKRAETAQFLVLGLDHERMSLTERVKELTDESDKVLSWLKVYDKSSFFLSGDNIDDAFEGLDKRSEVLLELKAYDNAIEDVMYALDDAITTGVMDCSLYMKQVRILAREQFMHRAKTFKVETSTHLSFE